MIAMEQELKRIDQVIHSLQELVVQAPVETYYTCWSQLEDRRAEVVAMINICKGEARCRAFEKRYDFS